MAPGTSTDAPPRKSAITCRHYSRACDSRRCRHYREGGLCQRPGSGPSQCIEWLKVNAHSSPAASTEQPIQSPPTAQTRQPTVDRDLFGNPVQSKERLRTTSSKPQRTQPAPHAPAPALSGKPPLVRNVTDEEIASFKALGAEVCIRTEALGDVHLVPIYTDLERIEISIEHSITLTAICAAFPGAKVVAIKRAG